jgi:hypothetical protein
MKHSCDLVKDLLPLYHDDVCSAGSKQIVEEHLEECAECGALLEKIKNETYDKRLTKERENVVGRHTVAVKRKSMVAGVSIGGVLTVPVIVCLIVNLAVGRALDWFFIVLTSLMVVASVTVVPLVKEERKFLWTLGSFTGSLMLLLMTCAIYTGGNWFFVVAIPVLFGLAVLFAPFIVCQLPLKGFASRHTGLLVMAVDTVLLYAVIITSGLYVSGTFDSYWRIALTVTSVCLIFPWGLFAVNRYLKANGLTKSGICTIFSGIFFISAGAVIDRIVDGTHRVILWSANLSDWSHYETVNSNINVLVLITCLVVGGALLGAGRARKKKS